jgi:hypothetical protein
MDTGAACTHSRRNDKRERDMPKLTPYLAKGCPKICWGCGKPFVMRGGHAEAILAPDDRLYCYGTGCADAAFVSRVVELRRAA